LRALAGQVWLAGDDDHDVDDPSDTTPILVIEGTATRGGDVRPFSGTITIASNRIAQGGPVAGSNTLCKQRIVSPIPTSVTLAREGGLLLRIDPRRLFVNVDFGKLTNGFTDDDASQPSVNLYQNLHAAS